MLKVKNLTKKFAKFTAVSNESFEVVAGGPLDTGRFGLAYSSIGNDVECNDFMEHVQVKTHEEKR